MVNRRARKKPKLTKETYFSKEVNDFYWSASIVKNFLSCPARAVAELKGEYERPPSSALLIGSYVDTYFEGKKSFQKFCAEHFNEIYKKQTKKAIEEGLPPEKYADFVKADAMIKRCTEDEVFMEYMRGQKQKIVTGKIGGFDFRAKLDVYLKDERIVDMKTLKDFEPMYKPGQGRLSPIEYWDWPLQLAIYNELVFQKTQKRLPTYLNIVTKEDPPDLQIVEVPQEVLDSEMEFLLEKMPLFDAYRQGVLEPERCECCAYCRQTHKLDKPRSLEEFTYGE